MKIIFALLVICSVVQAQTARLSSTILNRPIKTCSGVRGAQESFKGKLWPQGVVPYEFDNLVTIAQKTAMRAAMDEWEGVSPVKFIEKKIWHSDYVFIKDDPDNWSFVGLQGNKQEIGIYNWNTKYVMLHELCHALGFCHTQTRPDRDSYITVNTANIKPTKLHNFAIDESVLVMDNYDFDSVMHYSESACAINPLLPTISVKPSLNKLWQTKIGQLDHLSIGDIRRMNIVYGDPRQGSAWYANPRSLTDTLPLLHSLGGFPACGNHNFGLTAKNLTGGAAGTLFLSMGYTRMTLPTFTILTDYNQGFPLPCQANGAGVANLSLPIPNYLYLIGQKFFLQGFFLEPKGICTTHGLWSTFQPPTSKNVTAIYDRQEYRQHVTNSLVGRAVWDAHKIDGFSFVRTQSFSCGGQSHHMIIVKDKIVGIEFMLIPGGAYQMGDINNLGGTRHQYEIPVHWVHIEPFLMAKTEITRTQWQTVMNTTPWKVNQYYKPGSNCAASYINSNEAALFCSKFGWRLPSESEWEYACRAGTTTGYNNGLNTKSGLTNYAWFCDNVWNLNIKDAQPVGVKKPNAFGLYDMHGNIREWCLDPEVYVYFPVIKKGDYKSAPINGTSWGGAGGRRVNRGGDYRWGENFCRSAARTGGSANERGDTWGFRPIRELR